MPPPILKPVDYPHLLHPHHVNLSSKVLHFYTHDIVPHIAAQKGGVRAYADASGDRRPAVRLGGDVRRRGTECHQPTRALWYAVRSDDAGMFVSESKFRSDPASFLAPIQARDRGQLAALITKPAVEAVLLRRVGQKAEIYGQNLDQSQKEDGKFRKIQSQEVVRLYQELIIPLTKEVEVDYLLERYVSKKRTVLTNAALMA